MLSLDSNLSIQKVRLYCKIMAYSVAYHGMGLLLADWLLAMTINVTDQ